MDNLNDNTATGAAPALAQTVQWGGLKVHLAGQRKAPTNALILLHGWGAPGDDLVSLAQVMDAPGRLLVFPEAPLVSPGGGRAWWHLDLAKIMTARQQGQERDQRNDVPKGLDQAQTHIKGVISDLQKQTDLGASQIALGGFSQGAMLATDTALALTKPPAALIVMSGTVLAQKRWEQALRNLGDNTKSMPTFISHGTHDQVLPFSMAEFLKEMLEQCRVPVQWRPFAGGHEIPMATISAAQEFLDKHLPRS